MSRPPLPPFTLETAKQKVQAAEDGWNTKDPDKVALAYTVDSEWRNRAEFFLRRKWDRELNYRLRKYLWAFTDNRISVCFEYEYHDASGQWYRAYGLENWEFDTEGLMRKRVTSINEAPIAAADRRIAVDGGAQPVRNAWLAEQGLSEGLGQEFPLGDGSQPCY
ncbi:hypothetical protein N2152v2_003817 [Parachlorella kessleri]